MRSIESSFSDFLVRMLAPVAEGLSFLPRATAATPSTIDAHPTAPTARARWLERLDRWYWAHRQRAIEAALARSNNVADLEARIRDLGREVPSRYY